MTELIQYEFVLSILNKDQKSRQLLIHAQCKASFDRRLYELQQSLNTSARKVKEAVERELDAMTQMRRQNDYN